MVFSAKKSYFVWMEPSVLWCCWLGGRKGIRHEKQESLANPKLNAWQYCVSLSCLCNSLTQIEWVVQLLLPPKHAKSCEIPGEFDLTAIQGHPWSSIFMSIESPYATSYYSLIVTLRISGTVFEILMLKGRKWLILPTHPLFEAPVRGTPSEFRDETYRRKTRGMGYSMVRIARS